MWGGGRINLDIGLESFIIPLSKDIDIKTNLDNIRYFIMGYTNSAINRPANTSNGYFICFPSYESKIALQIYITYNIGDIYMRQLLDTGSFTDWKLVKSF